MLVKGLCYGEGTSMHLSRVLNYEHLNIVKHRLHVCSGAGARLAWSLDTGQLLLPWWPGWPGCLLSCLEAWRRGGGSTTLYTTNFTLHTITILFRHFTRCTDMHSDFLHYITYHWITQYTLKLYSIYIKQKTPSVLFCGDRMEREKRNDFPLLYAEINSLWSI